MDIDISNGPRSGWIYTVGVEKSSDSIDVVLHRSTYGGETWNYSKKVKFRQYSSVKLQFMPAINVDKYGGVNIMYYDARNSTSNDSFEVYLSRSTDGGLNFTDTKISDHKIKFSEPAVFFWL
ncbi:MAG: sialidase family protein [Ignavibacteria bacterium]